MHPSAQVHMARKVERYFAGLPALRVVDIGSLDVNGTYRPQFDRPGWSYTGVDLAAGPNVDVVLEDAYHLPFARGTFDVAISGSTFEHVEFFWRTFDEMCRVVRPGGWIVLIVPSRGPEHRFPVDCWRFYPDSMRALARHSQVELVEAHTDWAEPAAGPPSRWGDTVGVFRVPQGTRPGPGASTVPEAATARPRAPSAGPSSRPMEDRLDAPLRELIGPMQDRIVHRTTYLGVPTLKNPLDLWVMQELVFELRPDVIVEIGTRHGGSALVFALLCDALGHGRVISVDVDHRAVHARARAHPRITLLEGDACERFAEVATSCAGKAALVIEDSSHTFDNTLRVLRTYAPLVPFGGYFIVEDGICHHGLDRGPSPGPYEAIAAFLAETPAFAADRDRESFGITWNPMGYLRRVGVRAGEQPWR